MAAFLSNGGRPLSSESDRPPKRISTPAGMRLSVIMENTIEQKSRPRKVPRLWKSGSISNDSTLVNEPRESRETEGTRISGPMGYSYDITSEKMMLPPPTLASRVRGSGFVQKKGGWRRLLLILAVLLLCLIAIIVGVVVGVSKSKKSDASSQGQSSSSGSGTVGVVGAAGSSGTTSTGVGSSPTSTSVPNGFPLGRYSFSTFLDTVTTDCTSNPSTWTCFPYIIYNTDHAKALTTFNWEISGGSINAYTISSMQDPFAVNFQNIAMKIVDHGTDTEHYQFQITMDKTVVPSSSITSDGSASECIYNATTMTGYLYTKQAKDYPTAGDGSVNSTYQAWPYAVRVEQTIGGGVGVPNCYKDTNGNLGEKVGSFNATDPTTLCSCLYRNYLTPGA